MTEPLVLRESFAESLTERHHRQSFVGSILALLLLPTGVALDLTVYPEICLLYTSPSPRDLSTSRMPSSA